MKQWIYNSYSERGDRFYRFMSVVLIHDENYQECPEYIRMEIIKWNFMNTTTKIITGFLAGASLGILTGILIAPDSGKKTREQIADKTKGLKNRMVGSYDDVKKAYNKELESLMNSGKSGIDSLKNTLKVWQNSDHWRFWFVAG